MLGVSVDYVHVAEIQGFYASKAQVGVVERQDFGFCGFFINID